MSSFNLLITIVTSLSSAFVIWRYGRKIVAFLLRKENRRVSNTVAVVLLILSGLIWFLGTEFRGLKENRATQHVEEMTLRIDEHRSAYDSVVRMPVSNASVSITNFFYNIKTGTVIEVTDAKQDRGNTPAVGDDVVIHRDKNHEIFMCNTGEKPACLRVRLHKMKAYYYQ